MRRLAILNLPRPQVLYRLLLRGNLEQIVRSSYVYFFHLPYLPERLLSMRNYRVLRRIMQGMSPVGGFTEHDLDVYADAWRQPGALSAMIGYYRDEFGHKLRNRDVEELTPATTPTLMIWGRRDSALAYTGATMSAETLRCGALVPIPQAGHFVHEDFPDLVNGLLLSFFSRA